MRDLASERPNLQHSVNGRKNQRIAYKLGTAISVMLGVVSLGFSTPAYAKKLCTYEVKHASERAPRIGILTESGDMLDMNRAYAFILAENGLKAADAKAKADKLIPPDMIAWLDQGDEGQSAVDKAMSQLGSRKANRKLIAPDGHRIIYSREEIQLLSPIPQPRSLRDAGGFLNHVRNMMSANESGRKTLALLEVNPLYVTYAPTSVAGTDAQLLWPNYSDVLDYEMEIAVVIGKKGKNITESEAKNYIAGFTIFNDMSARDYQMIEMAAPFGAGKGKNWDGGNVLGPCLVTPDEFDPDKPNAMIARVNGEEWGRGLTSSMHHKFAKIISFISQEQTLYPGDVIGSATVENGSGLEIGRLMNPGDEVELEIEGIGKIKNRFVQEKTKEKLPFPSAIATLLPNELYKGAERPMKVIEVAPKVFAGLQMAPNQVGLSNMMYVADGDGLVVDTLIDDKRTQRMIDLFNKKAGTWKARYLVNTHADSDHVWGNQLFQGSEIIGHRLLRDMPDAGPKLFTLQLARQDISPVLKEFMGTAKAFDFRNVKVTRPTRYIADGEELNLSVGKTPVIIKHIGPAHKESDTIVYLPDQGVLFAGDLVFNGLTPHATASYENVMSAYSYLESLKPRIVIPGHDDLTDAVQITKTKNYFKMVHNIAVKGFAKGLSPLEAAKQADIGEYAAWAFPGQIMITLNNFYFDLGADLGVKKRGDLMLRGVEEAAEVEKYWAKTGKNQSVRPKY